MFKLESIQSRVEQWALAMPWPQRRKSATHRLIRSPITIPALTVVSFFLLNLRVGGPAYLSDEVGYLDKAATIAGSAVHLTTAWFGGYSFMISPAFFFSSDPYVEWKLVLLMNALMWAGSAALLRYVLRATHPKATDNAIFFATLGTVAYPSWLAMSGYALATSGFVLVYMGTLAAILKSELTHRGWLCIAGLLAGLLAWIHPLGLPFLALFAALLAANGILQKQKRFWFVAAGALVLGVCYFLMVQPFLNHLMSGSIVNDDHYATSFAGLFKHVLTLHYWLHFVALLAGLSIPVIVSTFGLTVYGSIITIRRLRSLSSWRQLLSDAQTVVMLVPIILIVGTIVIIGSSWALSPQLRIDQWVQGRYTDMFVMPLIGFGLLSAWRSRTALWLGGFVLAIGLMLSAVTNAHNTLFGFDNKVSILGFWPMQLASTVHLNQYWAWGALGACGVVVCGFMGTARGKRYLPLLLIPVTLTAAGNYHYHRTIVKQHATVSSLYPYVEAQYTASTCIGFTPAPDGNERFNLYSYYLHGYDIKKMTLQQWQKSCDGPYLTYNTTFPASDAIQIAGREATTGLYLITHANTAAKITRAPAPDKYIIFH